MSEHLPERLRLIVVDDDPLQLGLVERALSRGAFEVRAAATVAELAAQPAAFQPHIVLIDVNLPDAAPEEAIEVARRTAPGARIVLYSAWDEAQLRSLVLRTGADAFLSKSDSVLAIGPRLWALVRT